MGFLPFTCPQCRGPFHWCDGYPDLYEIRLCSAACLGAWLEKFHYTSTLPDMHPTQITEKVVQEMGDGRSSLPQMVESPEDSHRQME